MASAIHPIVKPEVVHLEDLFRAIDNGTLRIPDFQRPFVWNEKDMVELFESVKSGYPIGSILIWEPTIDVAQKWSKSVGPFIIKASENTKSFVIDGYQRLTTLYCVLKSDPIKQKEENWKYNIYLNIEKDQEELFQLKQADSSNPGVVPLHALWNSKDYFKALDQIRSSKLDPSGALLQRLEDIYSDFRGYKIAVTRMVGGDIEDAIKIFTKLNSTGRKVSEVQMLNALTNTDLESQFISIKEALREWNFQEIEDRLLLRAHYMATEMETYKMSPPSYIKISAEHPERNYSKEVKSGLSEAAKFLWDECGVPSIEWLPYALQLLLIGEFFRKCPHPSNLHREKLKIWFWQTSYLGWFAGANSTRIRLALKEMRALAEKDSHEIMSVDTSLKTVPFPLVYRANSARVSTFYLFYLSLNPRTINDNATPSGTMSKALMAMGPKKVLNPITSSPKSKNLIANLILCEPETSSMINSQFQNFPELGIGHGISREALRCLISYDTEGFLEKRQAELIRLESEFIKKWGLIPSDKAPKESSEDSDIE